MVIRLRSRWLRPGRFQTAPYRRSCVCFSSAGATDRTCSGEKRRPATLGCWALALNAVMTVTPAMNATRYFMALLLPEVLSTSGDLMRDCLREHTVAADSG